MTDSLQPNDTQSSRVNPLMSPLFVRMGVIAVIAMLMVIPLGMVSDVVYERGALYDGVRQDVANTWGSPQLLSGPLMIVPFTTKTIERRKVKDSDGSPREVTEEHYKRQHAVILPDQLQMEIGLTDDYRKRGIYAALVYSSTTHIHGTFEFPPIESLSARLHTVHWADAYLVMGLGDTRAINKISELDWNGARYPFKPGTRKSPINRGFHALLGKVDPKKAVQKFSFNLDFNGTSELMFAGFGVKTTVDVESTWPHPSFRGNALPANHTITEQGFKASWNIANLVRNYPQSWTLESSKPDLQEFTAGVGLFEPVFLYSKTIRAVKYGILFVVLTFITFVAFELSSGQRLHFVQYTVIGVALAVFYLVLLSSAEHLGFFFAYLIASLLTVTMISAYAWASLRRFSSAATVFVLLAALYALLYSLLSLEDYALMVGTVFLVVALGAVMYLTRNIQRFTAE